jgi:hypothetical protein
MQTNWLSIKKLKEFCSLKVSDVFEYDIFWSSSMQKGYNHAISRRICNIFIARLE